MIKFNYCFVFVYFDLPVINVVGIISFDNNQNVLKSLHTTAADCRDDTNELSKQYTDI